MSDTMEIIAGGSAADDDNAVAGGSAVASCHGATAAPSHPHAVRIPFFMKTLEWLTQARTNQWNSLTSFLLEKSRTPLTS